MALEALCSSIEPARLPPASTSGQSAGLQTEPEPESRAQGTSSAGVPVVVSDSNTGGIISSGSGSSGSGGSSCSNSGNSSSSSNNSSGSSSSSNNSSNDSSNNSSSGSGSSCGSGSSSGGNNSCGSGGGGCSRVPGCGSLEVVDVMPPLPPSQQQEQEQKQKQEQEQVEGGRSLQELMKAAEELLRRTDTDTNTDITVTTTGTDQEHSGGTAESKARVQGRGMLAVVYVAVFLLCAVAFLAASQAVLMLAWCIIVFAGVARTRPEVKEEEAQDKHLNTENGAGDDDGSQQEALQAAALLVQCAEVRGSAANASLMAPRKGTVALTNQWWLAVSSRKVMFFITSTFACDLCVWGCVGVWVCRAPVS